LLGFQRSKEKKQAGYQWLITVVLVTQEAEIRRIEVQSQPRQIVHKILISKIPNT
jgi:hypothetical protein